MEIQPLLSQDSLKTMSLAKDFYDSDGSKEDLIDEG